MSMGLWKDTDMHRTNYIKILQEKINNVVLITEGSHTWNKKFIMHRNLSIVIMKNS